MIINSKMYIFTMARVGDTVYADLPDGKVLSFTTRLRSIRWSVGTWYDPCAVYGTTGIPNVSLPENSVITYFGIKNAIIRSVDYHGTLGSSFRLDIDFEEARPPRRRAFRSKSLEIHKMLENNRFTAFNKAAHTFYPKILSQELRHTCYHRPAMGQVMRGHCSRMLSGALSVVDCITENRGLSCRSFDSTMPNFSVWYSTG